MIRDNVIRDLQAHKSELAKEFGITAIGVFGSVARNEETGRSDVDVLVSFPKDFVLGAFKFVNLKLELEEILGRNVDLATPETLHKALRRQILSETIYA